MKNLGKLKLNQISKVEMEKLELNTLKGGICGCYCGCLYSGTDPSTGYYGGSSTFDNGNANSINNMN